jgi:hypothetical protein
MRKKAFVLIIALLLVFGLAACQDVTTTTTTTSGTTTATTGTTTTTTAFSISITGTADAGFTPEDIIYANTWFDLLAGVSAMGSDGVDYKDRISFEASDAACQINEEGQLMSTGIKTCVIQYTVVVNLKVARVNRTIKISAAQSTIEFTLVPDAIDNEALLGTDKTVTTEDGGINGWLYWSESPSVLGTTGFVKTENDKLIIKQEGVGGNPYSLQVISLTNTPLVKSQMYKITMTITSTTARFIDIVTKAPNNNYADDTHSIIDISVGTAVYEMIFTANQTALHFNIMTGTVEGMTDANAGTLEFSNFELYAGPINREYVELVDFFKNDDIALGSEVEYITGADTDYVREFYFWDQSNGNLSDGETIADGVQVEVVTQPTDFWGIQLQWNDVNKVGTALKKDAYYKLTMTVNSPYARTVAIEITGSNNNLAASKKQDFSLVAGDNELVLEFQSLYDYFFVKMLFGNYGDLEQVGVYTVTEIKLFEEVGAVDPVDPDEPGTVVGNLFGTVSNVKETALQFEGIDGAITANAIWAWKGITDWFATDPAWTSFPTATATYNAKGQVAVDIDAVGPLFWAIQLKYSGGALVQDGEYVFAFHVYSEVARKIGVQLKNAAFGGTYVDQEIVLQAGLNVVEIEFLAGAPTFNFQFNLGKFDAEANEAGLLVFDNFMVTRQTEELADYIDNGDFATDMVVLGATDAPGWALWTTAGIPDGWALPNYNGTIKIENGVLSVSTTQKGGADWGAQIQYNAPTNDLVIGAVYRIEAEITSNVVTTIALQFKGTTDAGPHSTVNVTLNAGLNHVVVYLTAMQAKMRLFLLVGLTEPGTELTFDNFMVEKPIMVEEPVEPDTNKFDGKGNEVNTNMYWQKNGPTDPFTVTYDGTKAVVAADKPAGAQWSTIKLPVEGDFSVFGSLRIEVKGPAGTQILFKIDPNYEKWVDLTGDLQVVTWDISGIPANVLETLQFVFAFPGAHTNDAFVGSFEIVSFKWVRPVNVYTTADPVVDFDFNLNWADQWVEGYEVVYGATDVVVNYNRTAGDWTHIRSYVSGNLSDFDYIVLEITGPVGKQIIFKAEGPQGNAEQWFTFSGNKDTVVIDISALPAAQVNAFIMVLIFAEPQVGTASGTFTIHKAVFTNTNPAA